MVDTKKLEEVASRLNKTSDDINKTLQKIQNKLNASNIGLEVWMGLYLTSNDKELSADANGEAITPFPSATTKALEVYLGYAKTKDGWGLAVQHREVYYGVGNYGDLDKVGSYDLGDPESLLKASREIRIAALKHLQPLIDAIVDEAEAAVADIEKARQLADEM